MNQKEDFYCSIDNPGGKILLEDKSSNLENLRHIDLKKNFDNSNDNLANDFKNKLDHIKNRTKKLLEFYADKKISTINFNVNSNNN